MLRLLSFRLTSKQGNSFNACLADRQGPKKMFQVKELIRYGSLCCLVAAAAACQAAQGACELLTVGPTADNPKYAVIKLSPCDESTIASLKAHLVGPDEKPSEANRIPSVFGWSFDNVGVVHLRGWPQAERGTVDIVLRHGKEGRRISQTISDAFSISETGIDVVLLVDDSHSMRKTDPQKLRITAAKLFAEISAAREDVATLSAIAFSHNARVLLTPTPPGEKNRLSEGLDGLVARGSTDMDKAFVLAVRVLSGIGSRRKIGLVLSDGRDAPGHYSNAHRLFAARGWPVYTVGLSEECDSETLKKIADETGGKSFFAPTAAELSETFREIALSLHHSETVAEWPFTPGDKVKVPVDDTIRLLSLTLNQGPKNARTDIRTPAGTEYLLGKQPGETFVEIDSPPAGEWSANGLGKGSGRLIVRAASSLELMPFPIAEEVYGRKPVPITCLLSESDKAVTGAQVKAVFSGQQAYSSLELFDDGKHTDGMAGDGIYGGMLLPGQGPDQYRCRILAKGTTAKGMPFQRVSGFDFKVHVPETAGLWVRPRSVRLTAFPGEKKNVAIWAAGRGALSTVVKEGGKVSGIKVVPNPAGKKFPEEGALDIPVMIDIPAETRPGSYSITMTVSTRSAISAVSFSVDVNEPSVTVKPPRLEFGDILAGTGKEKSITVSLSPRGSLVYRLSGEGTLVEFPERAGRTIEAGTEHVIPVRLDIPENTEISAVEGTITVDWEWGEQEVGITCRVLKPEPPPEEIAVAEVPEPEPESEPKDRPDTNIIAEAEQVVPAETVPTGKIETAQEPEPEPQPKPEILTGGASEESDRSRLRDLDPAWARLLAILALLLLILLFFLYWLLRRAEGERTMLQYVLVSTAVHVLLFMLTMDMLIETGVVDLEEVSPTLAVKVQTLREKYTLATTPRGREIQVEDSERTASVEKVETPGEEESREPSNSQPAEDAREQNELLAAMVETPSEMSELTREEMKKDSEKPTPVEDEESVETKKEETLPTEDQEALAAVEKADQVPDQVPDAESDSRPEENTPDSKELAALPQEETSADQIRPKEDLDKNTPENRESINDGDSVPQHLSERADIDQANEAATSTEKAESQVSEPIENTTAELTADARDTVPDSPTIEHTGELAQAPSALEKEQLAKTEVLQDKPTVETKTAKQKESSAQASDIGSVTKQASAVEAGVKQKADSQVPASEIKSDTNLPVQQHEDAAAQVRSIEMDSAVTASSAPDVEMASSPMPQAKMNQESKTAETHSTVKLANAPTAESQGDAARENTTPLAEAPEQARTPSHANAEVLMSKSEAVAIRENASTPSVVRKAAETTEEQSEQTETVPVKHVQRGESTSAPLAVAVAAPKSAESTAAEARAAASPAGEQSAVAGVSMPMVIERETPAMIEKASASSVVRKSAEKPEERSEQTASVPVKNVQRGESESAGVPLAVAVAAAKGAESTASKPRPAASPATAQSATSGASMPMVIDRETPVMKKQKGISSVVRKSAEVPEERAGQAESVPVKQVERGGGAAGPLAVAVAAQKGAESTGSKARAAAAPAGKQSQDSGVSMPERTDSDAPVLMKPGGISSVVRKSAEVPEERTGQAKSVPVKQVERGGGAAGPLAVAVAAHKGAEPTGAKARTAASPVGEQRVISGASMPAVSGPQSSADVRTMASDHAQKSSGKLEKSSDDEPGEQISTVVKNVRRRETDSGPGRIRETARSTTGAAVTEKKDGPTGMSLGKGTEARESTVAFKSEKQKAAATRSGMNSADERKKAATGSDNAPLLAEVETIAGRKSSGNTRQEAVATVHSVGKAKEATPGGNSEKTGSGTTKAWQASASAEIASTAVAMTGSGVNPIGEAREIVRVRDKGEAATAGMEDDDSLLGADDIGTKKRASIGRPAERAATVSVAGATGESPEKVERMTSELPEQRALSSEFAASVPELMRPAKSDLAAGGLSFSIGKSSVRRRGSVPVCLVRYSGGDWDCSPTAMMYLSHQINERTGTALEASDRVIDLSDPELRNSPFIYMTGHKDFVLTDAEVANLRKYLRNGGRLWADDSTHFGDEHFDRAFRREIARVLPEMGLQKIPKTAELFKTGYDLTTGFKGYAVPPGDKYRLNYLEGIDIDNSTAVVYTRNDYGDGLNIDPNTHPLMPSLTDLSPADMQEGSVRMGINIVMYFLSAGSKEAGEFIDNTSAALRESQDTGKGPDISKMPADIIDRFADAETWEVEEWSDAGTLGDIKDGMSVDFSVADEKKFAITKNFDETELGLELELEDTLVLDVDNRLSCGARIALAVFCGDDYTYYESKPFFVKPGKNSAVFSLSDKYFKSETTEWKYSTKVSTETITDKLSFLVYSPLSGRIELRNLRVIRGR